MKIYAVPAVKPEATYISRLVDDAPSPLYGLNEVIAYDEPEFNVYRFKLLDVIDSPPAGVNRIDTGNTKGVPIHRVVLKAPTNPK